MSRLIRKIRVLRPMPGLRRSAGVAMVGHMAVPCTIGRSGVAANKREGDGATPLGEFDILFGYFRGDRIARPTTRIPLRPTRRDDGWCDDPRSYNYNRPLRIPTRLRHEEMTLESGVYDVVLATSYNMQPRKLGGGSAIFVHLRKGEGIGTEGCVAFAPADMRRILPRLAKRVRITVC